MPLYTLGLNHVSAPIAIRDRLAFSPELLPAVLQELSRHAGCHEVAILSTCNRVELYVAGELEPESLIAWLAQHKQMDADELRRVLYVHRNDEAVRHVMRVAAGLDSMVLGEPQIFGQLKDALAVAQEAGTVGSELARLFQQSFAVAKQVRTETAIGASAVSVAYAAVQLAKRIFGDLSPTCVLFVGAGETIQLCAQHLSQQGVKKMLVANRTVLRAQELAQQYGGEALSLPDLPQHIARADIVISSTASPLPIIGKGMMERAIKQRKHKPVFMVDLAVPRDIEQEVAQLDDVFLYSVDDLNGVVQENLKARQQAALQAEEIIAVQVESFAAWQRSRDANDTIRSLRELAQQWQQDELQRAQLRLKAGDNAEEVLQQLAHRLTNKFLHRPSEHLRVAASAQQGEALALVRRMFELDPTS